MSDNSEHNAGESNESHATQSEVGINRGRRALARAVLVGTPVILTLANRPSLAAINNQCTVSGQLSGNMSAAGGGGPCENPVYKGLTPGYWGQHMSTWASCLYMGSVLTPGTCTAATLATKGKNPKPPTDGKEGDHCQFNSYNNDGTKFHLIFAWKNVFFGDETMMQVIQKQGNSDRYQLGAHTAAALLNACYFGKEGYGYSPAEVVALFQTYANSPNAEDLKLAFQYLNEASNRNGFG